MKSSPPKDAAAQGNLADPIAVAKPTLWRRLKGFLSQFKQDLRAPLEGTEGLDRWGKVKARSRHLFKRYGWKLLVAICVYYLIRDGILYVLIPYLVAKKLLID
jgi:hypothetical protein